MVVGCRGRDLGRRGGGCGKGGGEAVSGNRERGGMGRRGFVRSSIVGLGRGLWMGRFGDLLTWLRRGGEKRVQSS